MTFFINRFKPVINPNLVPLYVLIFTETPEYDLIGRFVNLKTTFIPLFLLKHLSKVKSILGINQVDLHQRVLFFVFRFRPSKS